MNRYFISEIHDFQNLTLRNENSQTLIKSLKINVNNNIETVFNRENWIMHKIANPGGVYFRRLNFLLFLDFEGPPLGNHHKVPWRPHRCGYISHTLSCNHIPFEFWLIVSRRLSINMVCSWFHVNKIIPMIFLVGAKSIKFVFLQIIIMYSSFKIWEKFLLGLCVMISLQNFWSYFINVDYVGKLIILINMKYVFFFDYNPD